MSTADTTTAPMTAAQDERLAPEAGDGQRDARDRHDDQLDDLGEVQPLPVQPPLQERARHAAEARDQEDRRAHLRPGGWCRRRRSARRRRGRGRTPAAVSSRPLRIESSTPDPTCSRVQTRVWTRNAPKPSKVRIDASIGRMSTTTAVPYSAGEMRRARTTVVASPSTSATIRDTPTQRAPESVAVLRPSRSSWPP